MKRSSHHSDIEFGGPASYLIVVQGILSPEWSERLAGLVVTTTQEGAAPQTNLRGRIRDQAELNGVLDTLYNMHLPILHVERVDDEP
jgi:hypothetical protein